MDRRTFVLLTGASSAALVARSGGAAGVVGSGRGRGRALGRLRFELDERRRWSLYYSGDGAAVPLIRGGELVVSLVDRLLTLAELEDSAVGTRRPPGGDAVVVRGRAAGVFVEA
ncbi:MAG TPA: hypothetical protein VM736_04505, partial [Gemmatimonadales bacterium]|nr:hypothetical protein [Gemmatimonadales bacterium]